MTNLLKAEFLRLVSRRLTWAMFAGVMVLAALLSLTFSSSTRLVTDSERAEALVVLEQATEEWQDTCELEPEGCEGWPAPRLEDFLRDPQSYETLMLDVLAAGSLAVALAAVLAAALVGGEFSSGSLSTQLTFTPRRLHVMAAKLAAAVTGAVALTLAFVTSGVVIGTIAFLMLRGGSDVVASTELPMAIVRMLVTTLLVAALAASLSFGLASMGLAVGIGVVVLVVSEIAISAFHDSILPILPLMPSANLTALLVGEYQHYRWESYGEVGTVITFPNALLYGVVLVGLVTTLSALAFRRRDLLR